MESGPSPIESFESILDRIKAEFKRTGLSDELLQQVKRWRSARAAELDASRGTTEEPEVLFQLQSAQLFGALEQFDYSWDCLDRAWVYANQRGDIGLKATVGHWMDVIHIKK